MTLTVCVSFGQTLACWNLVDVSGGWIVAGKLKDRGTVISVALFLPSNCGTYPEG